MGEKYAQSLSNTVNNNDVMNMGGVTPNLNYACYYIYLEGRAERSYTPWKLKYSLGLVTSISEET